MLCALYSLTPHLDHQCLSVNVGMVSRIQRYVHELPCPLFVLTLFKSLYHLTCFRRWPCSCGECTTHLSAHESQWFALGFADSFNRICIPRIHGRSIGFRQSVRLVLKYDSNRWSNDLVRHCRHVHPLLCRYQSARFRSPYAPILLQLAAVCCMVRCNFLPYNLLRMFLSCQRMHRRL